MKPINITITLASLLSFSPLLVRADQMIQDDLIVTGSICTGFDCVNGENFGFDTIRLKENNVRIRFTDTSNSSSFPSRDWQITANDSTNGGLNKFSIENIDNGTTPFTIIDGAPNHSVYINANGYLGLNTSAPEMSIHAVNANTPTLRLEQSTAAGFSSQVWDIGGNETNFFVRDATSSGKLPLRISAGASNASIFVASDGDIGFETTTPDGQFDVAHSSNANNHAFLISPTSDVGVNIDNGYLPGGLFDVQTTGGKSRFTVASDGDVGVGTATPTGRFDVRDSANTASYLNVDATGLVGVGTNSPASQLHVVDTTPTAVLTSSSTTGLTVENTSSAEQPRILYVIKNKGPTGLSITDTSANGDTWIVANDDGALVFFKDDVSTPFMKLKDNGNLELKGVVVPNAF